MGIIGSAIGAAGAIFGGLSASAAMKKARQGVEAQREKNQDWYDRRYNEDSTQRADAQRILQQTEESIRQRNRAAAGSAAVAGGTEESVAASKAANSQALAAATSAIAAQGDARKDDIESTYLQNDSAFQTQIDETERQKANAIGQAVGGLSEAMANIKF